MGGPLRREGFSSTRVIVGLAPVMTTDLEEELEEPRDGTESLCRGVDDEGAADGVFEGDERRSEALGTARMTPPE